MRPALRFALRFPVARMHRWIGLLAGPVILVLGLSGSVLVYRETLDALIEGRPPTVEPRASTVSVDVAVAAAIARFPGAAPRAILLSPSEREPHRIDLHWRGDRVEVWVDPYRGTVLRSRLPDRSVLVAVHRLHASLHLGRSGSAIVGTLGLLFLVEGVMGLWLWPSPTWRRRASGSARRSRAGADAAHRLLGALTLAVNGLLGLTGALLAFAAMTGAPPDGILGRLHALTWVLHSGAIGGGPTRLVWALMGLTVAFLVVSGYLLVGAAERARTRGSQTTQ